MNKPLLDLLAENHSQWIAMATKLTANTPNARYAEDIVQEMYIKLHKYNAEDYSRLMYNDTEINSFYVWKTIQSIHNSSVSKNGRYASESEFTAEDDEGSTISIFDVLLGSGDLNNDTDINNREEIMKDFLDEVMEELDSFHWFSKKLMKIYLLDNHSMRSLSKKTDISLTTIFHDLKETKEKLRYKFAPRYAEILLELEEYDEFERVYNMFAELVDSKDYQMNLLDLIAECESEIEQERAENTNG